MSNVYFELTREKELSAKKSSTPHSLECLGGDILFLIFENLYNDVPKSLQGLRFVSRAIDRVATPFRYRTIQLKPSLVDSTRDLHLCRAWDHIHKFARHLIFSCEVDWELTVKLLAQCLQIERIDWSWWGKDGKHNHFPLPIRAVMQREWLHTRLHITECPLPDNTVPDTLISSSPPTNLVHFSPTRITEHSEIRSMGKFIAACKSLEALELRNASPGFELTGARLPAIKHLKIYFCEWPFTREEVIRVWDFSRLESLYILHGQYPRFFQSLPRRPFPALRKLRVIPDNTPPDLVEQFAMRDPLRDVILGTQNLEELDFFCRLPLTLAYDVSERGSLLRVLKIRDCIGHREGKIKSQTLNVEVLVRLQKGCPRLREMTLDFDSQHCDIHEFATTISTFRNLQILEIHTRTLLSKTGINSDIIDIDHEAAKELASFLVSKKLGLPFKLLTINVGGFTPFMWSITKGWDEQRLKGHHPERLFIFEWNDKGKLKATAVSESGGL